MRFLIDEMFPPDTCTGLANRGHDVVHVQDRGVNVRPASEVRAVAARECRVLVTESVKDSAAERDLAIVCVMKFRLRTAGRAGHVAQMLDVRSRANPAPYVGTALAAGQ
jgi:predicted nuclease of predicted toxin-antitoxin system